FNTLHLIATLFRVDPQRARHITIQLANFMRFNLGVASESLITLERECDHVQAYVEIIQARFANRLQIDFERAHTVANVLIPPSTIQPLVENAIQHGLKKVTTNGKIAIAIKNIEECIEVSVTDNGVGFDEGEMERIQQMHKSNHSDSGVGMYNVNQRLISLLGEDSRLFIENLPGRGSRVYFTIPNGLKRRNTNENASNDC